MATTGEPDLPHRALTDKIIAAFYQVANELGYGFAEIIYRRAIVIVLRGAGVEVVEEPALDVSFRGHIIGTFRPDLLVARTILVEVKALSALEPWAETQLLNYLKAAGGGVGLILNFGRSATFKRRAMGDPYHVPVFSHPIPAPAAPASTLLNR